MSNSLYPSSNPSPSVNIYPALRKLFFIFIIIFFLGLALFLIYQNGKSIYDHGI
jgi:hypothetical protein